MKTIKQIIEEYNLSPNEAEGFERMISMMMCLRKHLRLKELYDKLEENKMEIKKVTAKEIIEEVERRIINGESATEDDLMNTIGGLNGMDMETYMKGYLAALRQIKGFFETRV